MCFLFREAKKKWGQTVGGIFFFILKNKSKLRRGDMSVYAFKTKKKICCENVPDMHLWGKISQKNFFFNKNFRVGPLFTGRSGNRKHNFFSIQP